jgi:CBS-domain-containing membrane protein
MEIFISLLAGLVINAIAWFCMRYSLRTDVVVLIVAVLLGIGYAAFTVVIPPAAQEQAINFASKALSFSWLIWQFLIKPIANPSKAVPVS